MSVDYSTHYGNYRLIFKWILTALKWECKRPTRYIAHYAIWILPFLDHDLNKSLWEFLFSDPINFTIFFSGTGFFTGLFFCRDLSKKWNFDSKYANCKFGLYIFAFLLSVFSFEYIAVTFEAEKLGVEIHNLPVQPNYGSITFIGTIFFFWYPIFHESLFHYRREVKKWLCPPHPADSSIFNYEIDNETHVSHARKSPVGQTVIIGILCGLLIIIPILTFFSFFHITQFLSTDNAVENKIILNEKLWNKTDFRNILIGFLATAAAIVAVAFTVTQILISSLIDKYTPKVFEFSLGLVKTNRPFFVLITIIAICVGVILFMDLFEPIIILSLVILIADGFILGLIFFTLTYYDMFRVINPVSLLDLMTNSVLERMVNSDE